MQKLAFRFLLDEGFPKQRDNVVPHRDRTVAYEHLSDVAPEYANESTPDWFLLLLAQHSGFDGFVTRNAEMTDEVEPMITFETTSLVLVVWSKGDDDPIREWGQLVAYMPEILRISDGRRPCVVEIPKPQLRPKDHVTAASERLDVVARKRLNRKPREVRREYREQLLAELEAMERGDLGGDLK